MPTKATWTGGTGDDSVNLSPYGEPSKNSAGVTNVYYFDGLGGNDTLSLNANGKASYNTPFVSSGFIIGPAVNGVITVTGASSGGKSAPFIFYLTSIEKLVFYDQTVTLIYAPDTTPPTVAITSNKSALKIGETATITFTFSEAPVNFIDSDIVTTGGTLGTLTGSGITRTATFTPTGNTNSGTATIAVIDKSYTDAAGNQGAAGTITPSITFDTKAPTLAITSSPNALKIGETATITFTFSEDPVNFIASDIVTTGGTLGTLTGSGFTRTATFTPTANTNAGTASITVAAGIYTDAALNPGGAGTTPTITFDTKAPTLAITSTSTFLRAGQTALITFTFSEAPVNFIDSDIVTTGGTLGTLTGSGLTRTATFTPTGNTNSGIASITVAAGTYTDAALNSGGAGTTPSITFDTLAPTITITSNPNSLTAGQTATITFAFSEDPGASFVAGDITTVNGTLGSLNGSGTSRTAIFTPTAASGTATVSVTNASYTDTAGNSGSAGTTSIGISSISALDISEDTGSSATDFITRTAAQTITATLGTALATGEKLYGSVNNGTNWSDITTSSVSGTAVTWSGAILSGSSSIKLQVRNGDTVVSSASQDYVLDTIAPTVVITSDKSTLHAGETATIIFTFSEDPLLTFTAADDISFTGGTLSNFTTTGSVRTATFTPTPELDSTASIRVTALSYADLADNPGSAGTTPSLTIKTVTPQKTITGLHISADTGSSATDFITQTAAQTITGTLNAGLATGETLHGSVDNGTSWSDITGKVTGTAIEWNTATLLDGSHAIKLEVRNADNAGTAASQSYVLDTVAPTATFSPADGATNAAAASDIVLTFNEAILKGSGVIEIHTDTATGTLVASYDAATSANITVSGSTLSTLTINPTADLSPGAHYYVTLANGSIEDLAGNHFLGSSDYDFFVAAAADPYAASSGGGGGVGVALAGVGALGLLAFVIF